jgi:5-methyltetrahydrofolate--homocysteine methyltransferase
VTAVESLGLAAVGANCGRSLEDNAAVASEFVQAGLATPLWVKPNAGVPQVVGDAVVYPEDPESFARTVAGFTEVGARIVGGCCGSTPDHLAALARRLGRETSLVNG